MVDKTLSSSEMLMNSQIIFYTFLQYNFHSTNKSVYMTVTVCRNKESHNEENYSGTDFNDKYLWIKKKHNQTNV